MPDINNDDFADGYTDTTAPFGTIAPGGTATGSIESGGDADLFAVQLQAGFKYTISMNGSANGGGSLSHRVLTLLDANGNMISPYVQPSSDSGTFTIQTSGTYYIAAKYLNSSQTGTYSLQVSSGEVYAGFINLKNISGREGDYDSKTVYFEVTRTGGTAAFNVSYATRDGAATAGNDYLTTSGILYFAAGQMTQTVAVDILGDTTPEGYEQFYLEFSNATNGAIFSSGQPGVASFSPSITPLPSAVALILDDDSPDDYANAINDTYAPLGYLTVGTPVTGKLEVNGDWDTFAISLQAGHSYKISLDGAGTDAGTIYTAYTGIYNNSGSVAVDHYSYQGNFYFTAPTTETYYIIATSMDNYIRTGTYRLNVVEAPAYGSQVSISSDRHDEGNSGEVTFTFNVTRTGGSGAFSVNYRTNDGSARDGVDYIGQFGKLDFAANENSKTILVTVKGDTLAEQNESFQVLLTGATNGAMIVTQTGYGYIADDDTPDDFADSLNDIKSPFGQLATGGTISGRLETNGDKDWIAVQMEAGVVYDIYMFSQPASDYAELYFRELRIFGYDGSLLEGGGSFTRDRYRYIAPVTGTYYLEASSSSLEVGGYSINIAEAVFNSNINISGTSLLEGSSGTKVATFTITRTGGPGTFSVDYFTSPFDTGTARAEAGSDFTAISGTLNFARTENTKTVEVIIAGDSLFEQDETFSVNLTNAGPNVTIIQGYAIGTIRNDDPVPDDYADSFNDTTSPKGILPIGGTVTGVLETLADVDWFAIQVENGATYTLSSSSSYISRYGLAVYDSLGNPVFDSHDTNRIRFTASATGVYYVSAFNTSAISYTLSASGIFTNGDDHIDTSIITVIGEPARVWHALDGDDEITSHNSFETIYGDGGNDVLRNNSSEASIYGGEGDDTLYFTSFLARTIDGGEGFDTGIATDLGLADVRTFDMAARSLERMLLTVNGNLYTLTLGSNGERTETVTDTANTEPLFHQRTTILNSQGREELVDTIRDDGTRTILDYDLANSTTWSTILLNYDQQGRLDSTSTDYDDYSRVLRDEDQASANDWHDATYVYGTNSLLDYQDTNYDDDARVIADSDQDSAFTWDTYYARYAPGGAMDYQDFRYDSGVRIIFDMDQGNAAAWASQVNVYAPGNVLDYQDTTYDDGRRVIYDGDNGDASPVWDIWESFFDTSGVLTTQRITYDDGSMRVFFL